MLSLLSPKNSRHDNGIARFSCNWFKILIYLWRRQNFMMYEYPILFYPITWTRKFCSCPHYPHYLLFSYLFHMDRINRWTRDGMGVVSKRTERYCKWKYASPHPKKKMLVQKRIWEGNKKISVNMGILYFPPQKIKTENGENNFGQLTWKLTWRRMGDEF